ncbi:hypothetical protein JXL19_03340 [bacterium]|nr:hypothetical protein [bacterium]
MTTNNRTPIEPFVVRDCTLVPISTGKRAQNLRELRDHLVTIHPGSIYYHFWGGLLRPRFGDPEYNNDFASWMRHGLHDSVLAERVGIIDPTDFKDIEELRRELIDVIEERLDETEFVPWAKTDQQFHFIRSQIVVFDTHKRIKYPGDLATAIPNMTVGSIFYHFIDAMRRSPEAVNDFSSWLKGFQGGYKKLIDRLATIDPYFISLTELREQLSLLFKEYFEGE